MASDITGGVQAMEAETARVLDEARARSQSQGKRYPAEGAR